MDHKKTIQRGRELRSSMSPPEVILWKLIRGDRLGYRVRRQQSFEGYFLDFYIRDLMVAVEVDGRIHEGQYEYDNHRDKVLEQKGLTIIRIHARSIFENPSEVIEYLEIRLAEISKAR
jgi:very-short-patch-repair endonuclease